MPRHHLIRSLIGILLLSLFVAHARADADRPHRPVEVSVAWSPSSVVDENGYPLAEVVRYVVFASREGATDTSVATTLGDTTCVLKLHSGATYHVRVVGYDDSGRASEPSEWSEPIFLGPPSTPDLIPNLAKLPPNRPNPFNPATTIVYSVPGDLATGARISLAVFDVRGQLVRRFTVDPSPGTHEVSWNGTDDHGATVASGVYVTRFLCGDAMVTRRMTMLK